MEASGNWEPFGTTRSMAEDLAATGPAGLHREPARRLIVITCMDARIDPLRGLGLAIGDAHIIRNAGALITDDVLRSIDVSRSRMRTDRALVVGHTDCAGFDSDELAEEGVRTSMRALKAAVPELRVDGAMYDVRAGMVRPVA